MTMGLSGLELPAEWQWWPLKHAARAINRGSAPDYVDDGPVWAVSQAVNQPNRLDWDRARFHGGPRVAGLKGLLAPDDILINSTGRGTLGRIGYFTQSPDNRPAMADGHVTRVKTNTQVLDPRFGYYYFSSEPFQHYIHSALIVGATNQIELVGEKLDAAPVAIPPMEEQRRISDFLDHEGRRVEALKRDRRQQLRLLVDARYSAMTACVSGELLDLPADPATHPVLGRIPEGFRVMAVKRAVPEITVGVVVNPSTYFTEDGPVFIHGFNVRDGWLDLSNVKHISATDSNQLRKSQLSGGDVLVVRAGAPGRAAVVPEGLAGANCASVIILKRGDAIVPDFLAAFFNGQQGKGQVVSSQYGAAQEVISVAQVKQYLISLPEIALQRRLVTKLNARLNQIDELSAAITAQISLIEARWHALLTAAVTGQIDVTTARGVS